MERLTMFQIPDSPINYCLTNGMQPYFTEIEYSSELSFVFLESRKFKQRFSLNRRDGSLLGVWQEEWLVNWIEERKNTDDTKIIVALSQTPMAGIVTNRTRTDNGVYVSEMLTFYNEEKPGNCVLGGCDDFNSYPKDGFETAMSLLENLGVNLLLAGDQHIGIMVRYDSYTSVQERLGLDKVGIYECSAPAAINDIWWRLNTFSTNDIHLENWGLTTYELIHAWNVDQNILDKYTISDTHLWSADQDNLRHQRADGFLMATIRPSNGTFTCASYGYRIPDIPEVWSSTYNLPFVSQLPQT